MDWGNVLLCLYHGDQHASFAEILAMTPTELHLALSPPEPGKPLPPFGARTGLSRYEVLFTRRWRSLLSAEAQLCLARDGVVPEHLQPDLEKIHAEVREKLGAAGAKADDPGKRVDMINQMLRGGK